MTGTLSYIFFPTAVKRPSLNTTDHAVKTGYDCSGASSRVGTVCFFTCILGYEVAGASRHRKCQENGKWSGVQILCRGNKEVIR